MTTKSGESPPPASKSKISPVYYKSTAQDVVEAAYGRWNEILNYFGITVSSITTKHTPCPVCGGTDRFRFQNKCNRSGLLDGRWVCNTCSEGKLLNGFKLVAIFFGIDDKETFKRVAEYLGFGGKKSTISEEERKQHVIKNQQRDAEYKKQQEQEKKLLEAKEVGAITYTLEIENTCVEKSHPYLQEKNLGQKVFVTTKLHTVCYQEINSATQKIENKTQIIKSGSIFIKFVDVSNPEKFIGAQFISKGKNPEKERWPKRPIAGTPIRNAIHIIQGDHSSPYIGIVEGYATAISVRMATGFTVLMTVDEGGMRRKAERIQQLFPDKKLIFFGDNDSHKGHTKGQDAAYNGAALTRGFAIIPPKFGDWDDYRQKHGIVHTKTEIDRQLLEFRPAIEISDNVSGISINSAILLTNGKGASFHDALINHTNSYCICPLSGGKARISGGFIWSYTENKVIAPLVVSLYDKALIEQCRKVKGKKGVRFAWAVTGKEQKRLYALAHVLEGRFSGDIINKEAFYRLLQQHAKHGVKISPDIFKYIDCLVASRINQAKTLTKLDTKRYKHLRLPQVNGLLEWQPALEVATNRTYKAIFVAAQHEQGKTKSFIKSLFIDANTRNGGVVIAHREKLITQIALELKCFHYKNYNRVLSGFRLSAIKGLACCLNSFYLENKQEHFLQLLMQADSIFIDESVQVLKTMLTSELMHEELAERLTAAIKIAITNGAVIYFTDADQTTEAIRHWQQLLELNDNEILLVTAEPPERHFEVNVTCSISKRYYKTSIVNSIERNLYNFIPSVLAVEIEKEARAIAQQLMRMHPNKNIVLLTGTRCIKNGEPIDATNFIDNIQSETANIDLLIHTSVIGTGVSIKHEDQRFKKGYGLFTGDFLSATECLQMMRRFRNVVEWDIALLFSPQNMYLPSFYKDIASQFIAKRIKPRKMDIIADEINFATRKNKALFIPAFNYLLDEYQFIVNRQIARDLKMQGITIQDITKEDQEALMFATPYELKEAEKGKKISYSGYTDEERFSCEHALCLDYYRMSSMTEDAAYRWCRYSSRMADYRLELLVNILRLDPTIKEVEIKCAILNEAGISLELIQNQRLTSEKTQELTTSIISRAPELVKLELLDERYTKINKPPERPSRFISDWLKSLGFEIDLKQSSPPEREYQLEIQVNEPMISRLSLETLSFEEVEKQAQKTEALVHKESGLSLSQIAELMNLTKVQVDRLTKN